MCIAVDECCECILRSWPARSISPMRLVAVTQYTTFGIMWYCEHTEGVGHGRPRRRCIATSNRWAETPMVMVAYLQFSPSVEIDGHSSNVYPVNPPICWALKRWRAAQSTLRWSRSGRSRCPGCAASGGRRAARRQSDAGFDLGTLWARRASRSMRLGRQRDLLRRVMAAAADRAGGGLEATSALDSKTQPQISQSLESLQATCIVTSSSRARWSKVVLITNSSTSRGPLCRSGQAAIGVKAKNNSPTVVGQASGLPAGSLIRSSTIKGGRGAGVVGIVPAIQEATALTE